MAERRLLLVRHGAYEGKGAAQVLTSLGRRQARLTARRLRHEPLTAIHCSTLLRAVETAAILAEPWPDLVPRRSPLLNECLPSVPPHLADRLGQVPAERLEACRDHARRIFRRHFRATRGADRCELIVGHGNLMRYLIGLGLGLEERAWGSMALGHCGISEFSITSRGRILFNGHNDVGHLPPGLRSG